MIYIYDIILNYNKNYIEYFEWDSKDILTHIKKIPIYRVKNNINLKNICKIYNKELLNKIYNKTETYSKKKDIDLTYSVLLCTNEKVISLNLNNLGNVLKISDLIIPEEDEILEGIDEYEYIDLNFKEIINDIEFNTRNQRKLIKIVKNKLNKCNNDFLKYLYIETYNKSPNENFKSEIMLEKNINNINLMNNFLTLTQNKK